MLEGGANVRLIQEMLGHASLTIRQLNEAHERSQPGATLNPNPKVKAVARRSGQG